MGPNVHKVAQGFDETCLSSKRLLFLENTGHKSSKLSLWKGFTHATDTQNEKAAAEIGPKKTVELKQ